MVAAAQMLTFVILLGSWFPAWLTGMKMLMRESLAGAFHGELTVTRMSTLVHAAVQPRFLPLSG